MNRRSARLASLSALLVSASALLAGCAESGAPTPPVASSEPAPVAAPAASVATPAEAPAPDAVLVRVPADETCMMNNRHMKAKQIPVEVEGRTYFGCCAMCKTKLETDAAARTGTDPVTGKPVDKATAIIGSRANGALEYFESEQTFAAYVKAGGPPPRDAAATAPASTGAPAATAPSRPAEPPQAPAPSKPAGPSPVAAPPPPAEAPKAPAAPAPPAPKPPAAASPPAAPPHHDHANMH